MPAHRANALSDLQGVVQLATESVTGVTGIVESMHRTIQRLPLPLGHQPEARTRGLTGRVYASVRGITSIVGGSVGGAVGFAAQAVPRQRESDGRRRARAIVNGLWGDHLEATGNPLALPMQLRWQGAVLDPASPESVITDTPAADLLVFVHGLCLSDLAWQRADVNGLAAGLGATPLHLSYNTGRALSRNGQELARLLESLCANWPMPVRRLSLVGHSMGGLVIRSACHHGVARGQGWVDAVDRLVFLGTPHAGAPLEKAGAIVEQLIELSPYSAPLALLGRKRSAGITDLRSGNVTGDRAVPPRLPPRARCHTLAAVLERPRGRLAQAVIGDGLVPLASALGQDPEPAHRLPVAAGDSRVLRDLGHMGLLSDDRVFEQLARWLAIETPEATCRRGDRAS